MPQRRTTAGKEAKTSRIVARVACNECRKRKTACNGGRPECSTCIRRHINCQYDTVDAGETRWDALQRQHRGLQAKVARYEALIAHLVGGTDQESYEGSGIAQNATGTTPRRLRMPFTVHPLDFVSMPEHTAYRSSLPSTASRLEYQLMVSHPALYPCLATPKNGQLSLTPLLGSPRWISSDPSAYVTQPGVAQWDHNNVGNKLLHDLDIGYWTDVTITDEDAKSVLSHFLLYQQPIVGFVDTELFLGDLIAKRAQHCSRFLVSSLLYWACHAQKPLTPTLSLDSFCDEAIGLWPDLESHHSATAVAGAMMLSIAAASDGKADISTRYMQYALDNAAALGWYGPPGDTEQTLDQNTSDRLRAESHVAWALFNYITMSSFLTQNHVMYSPPVFPIPGSTVAIGRSVNNSQPLYHRLPHYMGKTFTAACEMYLLANQISLARLAVKEKSEHDGLSWNLAEDIYRRLLDWSDSAPLELDGSASDPHHISILQMWFHCHVLDLFRPFLEPNPRLKTFTYRECTAWDAYTASLNQLKRHVLVFPLRYPDALRAGWLNPVMLHLTGSVIADPMHSQSRFWLATCLRILRELSNSYPILTHVLRLFTLHAVDKGILEMHETYAISHSADSSIQRTNTEADLVLDFTLALTNREDARMDKLTLMLELAANIREAEILEFTPMATTAV